MDGVPTSWLQPADLDPELEAYRDTSAHGIPALRHPLVYSVPYAPSFNSMLNEQLRQRKAALTQAIVTRDWHLYVFLHERPWRATALHELVIRYHLKPEEYWPLMAAVWTDTENLHQWGHLVKDLLERGIPHRELMMEEDELDALNQLPDVIQVYRGHDGRNPDGWSWTTDKEMAEWFARRLAEGTPQVTSGEVMKWHVIACFTGSGESEIVINPKHVMRKETSDVEA